MTMTTTRFHLHLVHSANYCLMHLKCIGFSHIQYGMYLLLLFTNLSQLGENLSVRSNNAEPFCQKLNLRRIGKMAPPYQENLAWQVREWNRDFVKIREYLIQDYATSHHSLFVLKSSDNILPTSSAVVLVENLNA